MKRVVLGLIIATGLLSASLGAQAVTGTILGSVTDTTNATNVQRNKKERHRKSEHWSKSPRTRLFERSPRRTAQRI